MKLIVLYLSNRIMKVKHNDVTSDSYKINCSVPQGSILGPLFFIGYIDDIIELLNYDVRLYADDLCLIYTLTNVQDAENHFQNNIDLNRILVRGMEDGS